MACLYSSKFLPLVIAEYDQMGFGANINGFKAHLDSKGWFAKSDDAITDLLSVVTINRVTDPTTNTIVEVVTPVEVVNDTVNVVESKHKDTKTDKIIVTSTKVDSAYIGESEKKSRMLKDFKREILERAKIKINFDKSSENYGKIVSINPDKLDNGITALNWNLLEYKVKLIGQVLGRNQTEINNKIQQWKALKKNKLNDIEIDLNQYLSDIKMLSGINEDNKDAYIALMNFDELITKECPFIEVDTRYENDAVNKYKYVSTKVEHFTGWTSSEFADSMDQSNKFIRTLLDYIPEISGDTPVEGSSIGLSGFFSVCSAMRDTVLYHPDEEMLAKRKEILQAGVDGDFKALIQLYLDYLERQAKRHDISNFYDTHRTYLIGKLKGIQRFIFDKESGLDKELRDIFNNMFFKNVQMSYVAYSFDPNTQAFNGVDLKQNMINQQTYALSGTIASAVYNMQTIPELFSDLFSAEDSAKYKITKNETYGDFAFTFNGKTFWMTNAGIRQNDLTFEEYKTIFFDVFGYIIPDNYIEVGKMINGENWSGTSELAEILEIGLRAALERNTGVENGIKIQWEDNFPVNLNDYYKTFALVGRIISVIYGSDTVNVIKNVSRKNNLPLFGLTSLAYNFPFIMWNHQDSGDESIYTDSFLFDQSTTVPDPAHPGKKKTKITQSIVRAPKVRSQVLYNGKLKDQTKLTVAEVAKLSILDDFYNNYTSGDHIYLQHATLADKGTHFLVHYDLNTQIYTDDKGKKWPLKEMIDKQIELSKSGADVNSGPLFKLMQSTRSNRYTKLVNNIISDYEKVFGLTSLDQIIPFITGKNAEEIRKAFYDKGVPFLEEIHGCEDKKGNLRFNETILKYHETFRDPKKLETRLNEERQRFIEDLDKNRVTLSTQFDSISEKIAANNPEWVEKDGTVILHKDGKLHPVLEAYFMTNDLLSNEYNEVMIGGVYAHTKSDESSRLIAQIKRSVIYGATMHSFAQNLDNGVAKEVKIACMPDIRAHIQNIVGVQTMHDSMDGSGLTTALQARLESNSLLDARVGYDKKTIGHDIDSKYGRPILLKWAVYAITNARRRIAQESDVSMEVLCRKMYSAEDVNYTEEQLTEIFTALNEQGGIYFKDVENTGNIYRITGIRIEGNRIYRTLQQVNENGSNIGTPFEDSIAITNKLWDIDQGFGGAWAMSKNANGIVDYSEKNVDALELYVTTKNTAAKTAQIGYLVNKSAIKVGAGNMNTPESWRDDSVLRFMSMRTRYIGVQMDAEHDLEHNEVTEMTQMISALIQNGYTASLVNKIYSDIGAVITEALNDYQWAINTNDADKIYRLLGEAFIKSFEENDRDTIGLAQAFVLKASKAFKENNLDFRIPFSAETVQGIFVSTVSSMLTKKGIRRKYEGFAGVLSPSFGMMQYYQHGGKIMMYEQFAEEVRRLGIPSAVNPITGQVRSGVKRAINDVWIDGQLNPYMKPVNPTEVDFEDTVVIFDTVKTLNPDGTESVNIVPGTEQRIYVQSYKDYRTIRDMDLTNKQIFNWTSRPKNLKGTNTKFKINGVQYSMYDLDVVRELFDFREAVKNKQIPDVISVNISGAISETNTGVTKIISGGQTGVDTIGLLVAESLGLQTGGTSTKGFITEGNASNQELGTRFGLIEITDEEQSDYTSRTGKTDKYTARTELNVRNSDGTVYFYNPNDELGYKATLRSAKQWGKPFIANPTAEQLTQWILSNNIKTLNVAGNRGSKLDPNNNYEEILRTALLATKTGQKPQQTFTKEQYERHLQQRIQQELRRLDKGKSIHVNGVEVESGMISDVYVQPAQIITGRYHAKQFILNRNENVSDVLEGGIDFFKNKLSTRYSLDDIDPIATEIKADLVLFDQNADKWLVKKVTNTERNNLLLNGFVPDADIETINGKHYLNQELITDLEDVMFCKYKDSNGNVQRVILASNDSADKLYRSKFFELYREYHLTQKDMYDENDKFNYRIQRRAELMYETFKKQLQMLGTRIPTQGMASFMPMEIVGFTDSEVNDVYIPPFKMFTDGSDLDIDKIYLLGYSISDSGKLFVNTKLAELGNYSYDDLFDLLPPNDIEYVESDVAGEDVVDITGAEIKAAFSTEDPLAYKMRVALINKVIESGATKIRIIDSDEDLVLLAISSDAEAKTYNNIVDKFFKHLNRHTTTRLSEKDIDMTIKNQVANNIWKVTTNPQNQLIAQISVDMATEPLKDAAKRSPLASYEKSITSDNPMVMFTMQVQNMVGKEVIGITAVSMKQFFAKTAFYNGKIAAFTDLVLRNPEKVDEYAARLEQLVIKWNPFENRNTVFANLNFLDALDTLPDLPLTDDKLGFTSLRALLTWMQSEADRNDAILAQSGILSLATDNAKELVLAKINATPGLVDIYTYLSALGTDPTIVADLMISDVFGYIAKLQEGDLFNNVTNNVSVENAIKFYLGENFLGVPSGVVQNLGLISWSKDGKLVADNSFSNDLIEQSIRRCESALTQAKLDAAEERKRKRREKYAAAMMEGLEDPGEYVQDYNDFEEEPFGEEYLESDNGYYEDSVQEDDGDVLAYTQSSEKKAIGIPVESLDADQIIKVIAFLKESLKRNNNRVENYAKDKVAFEQLLSQLQTIVNEVLPGTEEQAELGQTVGINQGLRTKAFDKFKWLESRNNYYTKLLTDPINDEYIPKRKRLKRIIDKLNKGIPLGTKESSSYFELIKEVPALKAKLDAIQAFDFYEFMTNSTYQKQWINTVNDLKISDNNLEVILNVPHFRKMFDTWFIDEALLGRSSARFNLEREVLKNIKPSKTHTWSELEFTQAKRFVNDMLILNWFAERNFMLRLPNDAITRGVQVYGANDELIKVTSNELVLNSVRSLESFKRVMETYIIPELKKRHSENTFLRALTLTADRSKTGEIKRYLKLPIPMMDIDKSVELKAKYDSYLSGFKGIASDEICGMRVGDLFYLYNLIVNKDSFGQKSMTRLFEDLVNVNEVDYLVNDYNNWLSELDVSYAAGTPKRITYFESDLVNRIRTYVPNTKVGLDEDGIVEEKYEKSKYVTTKDTTFEVSDYAKKPTEISVLPRFGQKSNAKSVISVSSLISKLFPTIVSTRTEDNITFLTEDDWNKPQQDYFASNRDFLRNQKSFIYNGKLYINHYNADISDLVHEWAHVILARMKWATNEDGSINEATRNRYYEIVSKVSNHPNYQDIAQQYPWANGTDLNEEVLTNLFQMYVQNKVLKNDNILNELALLNENVNDPDADHYTDIMNLIEKAFNVSLNGGYTYKDVVLQDLIDLFGTNFYEDYLSKSDNEFVLNKHQKVMNLRTQLMNDELLTIKC